ncbi:inorganic pyrophosphatase [Simkania negevensis]|uniref:inorganic diphosphatase n=1 Tax=Simkania negevensis TaxID=83561 RepID=A0ABS3AV33_9BACT|nr:inorganic pyrophosphatase [Simkania negevensis]
MGVEGLYRAHPWHGVPVWFEEEVVVNCYVEITPTDTVKYEVDKESGLLKIDRPQKYSTFCPALYGFIPQTYSGRHSADHCQQKVAQNMRVVGDGDPLDICVITEKVVTTGNILVRAVPIGGFRMLDGDEADDKIIAVLRDDLAYGRFKDVSECPANLVDRLLHYFITYKGAPGLPVSERVQIVATYGHEEAYEVIKNGCMDYEEEYGDYLALYKEASALHKKRQKSGNANLKDQ